MNNYLIGGGIVAALAATWQQLKGFFANLRSLVVKRVIVYDTLRSAVIGHINANYTHVDIGDKLYREWHLFIKSEDCIRPVACKLPMVNGVFFKKPFKLLFINNVQTDKEQEGLSRLNEEASHSSITFIRGTVDIEQIMVDALKEWDENASGINNKRFYVAQVTGRLGATGNNSTVIVENRADRSCDVNAFRRYQLLGYDKADVGYNKADKHVIDTMALSDEVMEALKDIRLWLQHKEWYKEKGIPWTRGWLLYGPPGTGKTSLVRGIGQLFGLPVKAFNLNTFTDADFMLSWTNDVVNSTPCIALFEDIDASFTGRENNLDGMNIGQKPLSFNTLLNTLDGVDGCNGLFTIITTNNPDKLDPALGCVEKVETATGTEIKHITRPGRVDRIIEMKVLDTKCRRKIALRILSECSAEVIDRAVKDGEGQTGAQFQEYCAQIALHYLFNGKKKG